MYAVQLYTPLTFDSTLIIVVKCLARFYLYIVFIEIPSISLETHQRWHFAGVLNF